MRAGVKWPHRLAAFSMDPPVGWRRKAAEDVARWQPTALQHNCAVKRDWPDGWGMPQFHRALTVSDAGAESQSGSFGCHGTQSVPSSLVISYLHESCRAPRKGSRGRLALSPLARGGCCARRRWRREGVGEHHDQAGPGPRPPGQSVTSPLLFKRRSSRGQMAPTFAPGCPQKPWMSGVRTVSHRLGYPVNRSHRSRGPRASRP